ncbi:MAG TPA: di-heme oxidoredictase family protein [Gammaproteobacteria bacterium]
MAPRTGSAQLAECQQIDQGLLIDAPGGCISRPLRDQIGPGQGGVVTPGSSIYLIKRDPARAIRRGRQVFQRKFTASEGLGPRVSFTSEGDVTATRALGAGLADSCAACHGRPRGAAGNGGDVATFPDSRDAPHLFGLGLIEMLADEMTADLRAIRDDALAAAAGKRRAPVRRELVSKGVDFGAITAFPNGRVDTSKVEGVSADLRVRPFFAEGRSASIREFVIGAFNDEMGLQVWDPILCDATDPDEPQARESPAGFVFDPATDTFNRPPSCDRIEDPDADGVSGEVDPALVDYLEFYFLNYFKPARYRSTARAEQGLELMKSIGCTSCHVQNLTIERDRRIADVVTTYDPSRGFFNELFAEVYPLMVEEDDGEPYPQMVPALQEFVVENVFTDLKRHDLGPYFVERDYDGSRIEAHVTEPLWGVGNTAPYGHDGRSVTLDAVIRRHRGEAAAVTDAYLALSDDDQAKIVDFLETLIIFPPEDTASNLNPGTGEGDVQQPESHGSLDLGVLFQNDSDGPE